MGGKGCNRKVLPLFTLCQVISFLDTAGWPHGRDPGLAGHLVWTSRVFLCLLALWIRALSKKYVLCEFLTVIRRKTACTFWIPGIWSLLEIPLRLILLFFFSLKNSFFANCDHDIPISLAADSLADFSHNRFLASFSPKQGVRHLHSGGREGSGFPV